MKVFISHSTHDAFVARKISEDLNRLGIETFLDAKDIETGANISGCLHSELTLCDELLLLLSPISLKSHWVMLEAGGAQALKKKIMPILLHLAINDVPPPFQQLLARDINDIERYYTEVDERANDNHENKKRTQTSRPKRSTRGASGPKIGTPVVIVDSSRLTQSDKLAAPGWVWQMDRFSGAEASITGYRDGYYTVDVDGEKHVWAGRWLQFSKRTND